jgi:hypothetical protein
MVTTVSFSIFFDDEQDLISVSEEELVSSRELYEVRLIALYQCGQRFINLKNR